jgi:hypothetical protein
VVNGSFLNPQSIMVAVFFMSDFDLWQNAYRKNTNMASAGIATGKQNFFDAVEWHCHRACIPAGRVFKPIKTS